MDAATGRELRIAVVGATGAVGEQIVELIDARALPCAELALFATERGATQALEALGEALIVAEFHDAAELSQFDIAFLAVAPSWATEIVRARPGPLLVDLSAAVRAPAGSPLDTPGRARIHAGQNESPKSPRTTGSWRFPILPPTRSPQSSTQPARKMESFARP